MREAPVGCDPFGYLQAGQEFRQAYRGRGMPTFSIDAPQTRSLATYFTTLGIPLTDWEFVVGPHAYHYLPEVQRAISIYPPGAGWMLSLFPEGYAVRGWNLLTIAVLLVLGWAGIYWGKRRKAWVGMGLVALASPSTGLFMLRRIGEVTYSTSLVLFHHRVGNAAGVRREVQASMPEPTACRRTTWALRPHSLACLVLGARRPRVARLHDSFPARVVEVACALLGGDASVRGFAAVRAPERSDWFLAHFDLWQRR